MLALCWPCTAYAVIFPREGIPSSEELTSAAHILQPHLILSLCEEGMQISEGLIFTSEVAAVMAAG